MSRLRARLCVLFDADSPVRRANSRRPFHVPRLHTWPFELTIALQLDALRGTRIVYRAPRLPRRRSGESYECDRVRRCWMSIRVELQQVFRRGILRARDLDRIPSQPVDLDGAVHVLDG